MSAKSPYRLHVERWSAGCGASICPGSHRRCLARGSLPCDVLFVGEAPGESEDVLGEPFRGPAGQLLDEIVRRATGHLRRCSNCARGNLWALSPSPENPLLCPHGCGEEDSEPLKIAFTNVVGCIPRSEDGSKVEEPDGDDVQSCRPRLQEFVNIARPWLAIAVGKVAKSYMEPGLKGSVRFPSKTKFASVDHPAYILRSNVAQRPLLLHRAVVAIRTAVEGLG